jgi:hypothetical protein
MELFIGSFLIFILTAIALGIGILFRGRPMHAGCRGLPGKLGCASEPLCGGICRRRR